MSHTFAKFSLYKSYDEIPVKFQLVKKLPKKWFLKYVCAKEQIIVKNIRELHAVGYEVMLPVTAAELANADRMDALLDRVYDKLNSLQVSVIKYEPYIKYSDSFYMANGEYIFYFMLINTMAKALKLIEKQTKYVELLLIAGDCKKTELLLSIIYPFVNHITVFDADPSNDYTTQCNDIYLDAGLFVQITHEKTYSPIRTADVIINLNEQETPYLYKRGAIYFHLAKTPSAVYTKRKDIFTITSCIATLGTENTSSAKINMPYLETLLYCLSHTFRHIINGRASQNDINLFYKELEAYKLKISLFVQFAKQCHSSDLNVFIKNAGVAENAKQ